MTVLAASSELLPLQAGCADKTVSTMPLAVASTTILTSTTEPPVARSPDTRLGSRRDFLPDLSRPVRAEH